MEQHELYVAAKNAKTPEALLSLAQKNHVSMSKEESEKLFKKIHQNSHVSLEDLDDLAGGSGCDNIGPFPGGEVH